MDPRDMDPRDAEIASLKARITEIQRERDHLVAVVDILQEISTSLHFVDILQAIARKLGETFGLDRCSIFLTGESAEVRLVASYEDPSIRNLVVDLNRYPCSSRTPRTTRCCARRTSRSTCATSARSSSCRSGGGAA
jgi:GAF domain-containing protein